MPLFFNMMKHLEIRVCFFFFQILFTYLPSAVLLKAHNGLGSSKDGRSIQLSFLVAESQVLEPLPLPPRCGLKEAPESGVKFRHSEMWCGCLILSGKHLLPDLWSLFLIRLGRKFIPQKDLWASQWRSFCFTKLWSLIFSHLNNEQCIALFCHLS